MNALEKKRIKATFKYTWPFYLIVAVLIPLLFHFVFGIAHRTPAYKTLTLFVSGEISDQKTLESDMKERFKEKDIKSFSCISANPGDGNYNTKLTIAGYNTADVLILPLSKLDDVVVSAFGKELTAEMIDTYYASFSLYKQDEINYGIKLDKEKVNKYMSLPSEDCYMVLNGKSSNLGKYSKEENSDHDMALQLVKDWGI